MAAAVVLAAIVAVVVVVVVAACQRVVIENTQDEILHGFVSVALAAAVDFDSGITEGCLGACANTAADESLHT